MEERVPPPSSDEQDEPPSKPQPATSDEQDEPPSKPQPAQPAATSRSGTYLVQVPKVQVYRVPPPENALIAERHRNPSRKNYCCSLLLWIFIFIILLVVILAVSVAIFYLTLKPKNPTFHIDHVVVENPHSHPRRHFPEYNITLKTKNPNAGMGIFYQKGGRASLSFRRQEIATGRPPTLYQGYKDTKTFRLVLAGSDIVLPHEIQRSMKGKASKKVIISSSLSVNVPVRMKIGMLRSWRMNMDISCNFSVSTLAKGTRVLSQGCHTKLRWW